MKAPPIIATLLLCLAAQLFISCETTDMSYGYVATGLDEAHVLTLFELYDSSIMERDYDNFKSLFSPQFRMVQEANRSSGYTMERASYSHFQYMELARDFFRNMSGISIFTQVTGIQIDDAGRFANVTVQEDLSIGRGMAQERTITLAEVTIEYDDGWIFFTEWRAIARQEVKR